MTPLDRAHVTIASRIMLPIYPLFAGSVGLSLTLTPPSRLIQTPTFEFAADLLPLRLWGAGFLAVAVALVLALLIGRRATFVAALAVMCLWLTCWAGVTFASAALGDSTWSAWTWPAFVAVACFASMSSLLSREV